MPKWRFPKFRDRPTWAKRRLSEVLFEHCEKSSGTEEVFSVSVHKGVVNQIEHLGRSFSASNTDHYKRVNNGDVIYTKSPTGDFPFGIIKQSKVGKPVIVSPLYGVFRPETVALGTILDAYFEYRENVINYLSSIIQKGAKNTINIRNDVFLSKSLPLPTDLAEQQKIADCLSSLDSLITAHSAGLEALKAHKKGLLQQLFPAEGEKVPRLRFPEFQDSGEWDEKKLCSEGIAFFRNKKLSVTELNLGTYVSTENLLPDYGGKTMAAKLPSIGSFTKFEKGDILVSNIRPYLKKVWQADESGAASNDVIVIAAGEKIASSFLSLLIANDQFISFVMKSAEGVKMPRGDKDVIKLYPITFPSIAEQQKIASCLSSVDERITAQTEKLAQLKLHKRGLMQGLFPQAANV